MRAPRRWRISAVAACAAAAAYAATVSAAVDLPDIGDPSRAAVSPYEERQLGAEFMRNVRESVTVLDDPEIQEYIQSLGDKLVATVGDPEFDFHFFVVEDPTINAFAGPGGYVGVDSGLILITRSEAELAAVMAHETAHVTQHHLARAIADAKKTNLPTAAAIIAAMILATQAPELGQAALAAATAGTMQHQINFTRANEEEADRVGEVRMAKAGFDPRAMADFFSRMERATRLNDFNVPAFLQDHPVTDVRIAEAKARADQLLADYHAQPDTDPLNYLLMRAKLRVLTQEDVNDGINYFSAKPRNGKDAEHQANAYGYALALRAAGRDAEAAPIMDRLLGYNPNKIPYLIAKAQIELGIDHASAALQIFTDALKLYPQNPSLTVSYAQALLQNKRPQQATGVLRQYIRGQPPAPELYNLLARAEGEAGHPIDAHQSLAEYYYLRGQTRTAIEQLNIALSLSKEQDDPYQTPRIKARLEQLKQEVRANKE